MCAPPTCLCAERKNLPSDADTLAQLQLLCHPYVAVLRSQLAHELVIKLLLCQGCSTQHGSVSMVFACSATKDVRYMLLGSRKKSWGPGGASRIDDGERLAGIFDESDNLMTLGELKKYKAGRYVEREALPPSSDAGRSADCSCPMTKLSHMTPVYIVPLPTCHCYCFECSGKKISFLASTVANDMDLETESEKYFFLPAVSKHTDKKLKGYATANKNTLYWIELTGSKGAVVKRVEDNEGAEGVKLDIMGAHKHLFVLAFRRCVSARCPKRNARLCT